jgi:hypothetical protein
MWSATPPRYRIRLTGTRVAAFFGDRHTGCWFDEIFDNFTGSPTHLSFDSVVRTGQPSWRTGTCELQKSKSFAKFERVHLPFADDGRNIDMVLACSLFGEHGDALS